ncbi:response regulator [Occallatibacter riparius]|uniref:Response regulator transcription factor n=1 Tax=Occallatibacter riparius TaxID=1002689 RepID=A0A9J7BY45_9BACT|nr:response regulator transcription factor [Occallatibacter riparius]UWZ86086.1 response regulator transcription factor [Occallatibacter riparius]
MNTRPTVIIADDHTLVAQACKKLLEREFDVIAIVGDGRTLVRKAVETKPDAIVVDIHMPLLNGLDAGQQICKLLPEVKLLYVTMNPDPELAAEAFKRGAAGYLLKSCAALEVLTALKSVLEGGIFISPIIMKEAIASISTESQTTPGTELLTERQREVLQLLAEGRPMKQVADILNLTTRTVAFHKYRIMEALNLGRDAGIVRYALKNHILSA